MHIDSKLHLVIYLSISIVLFMMVCIAMQLFIIKKIISLGKDRSILNEDSEMTLAQKITSNNKLANPKDSLHCRGLAGWRRNNWTFDLSGSIVDRSESRQQSDQQFALPLMPIMPENHEHIADAPTDAQGYSIAEAADRLVQAPQLHQDLDLETSLEVAAEVVPEVIDDVSLEQSSDQDQDQVQEMSSEFPVDTALEQDQQFVLVDADANQTLDLEQRTAIDALTQVESMSEVERYHHDYFAEKIAVQHVVQQRLHTSNAEQNIEMTASRMAEIELIEDDLIEDDLAGTELLETVRPGAIAAGVDAGAEVLPNLMTEPVASIESQLQQNSAELQQDLLDELEQLAQPNRSVQVEHLDQIEQHEQEPEQSSQVETRPLPEQHSPLDHQKIIDTYQQIIEMYK